MLSIENELELNKGVKAEINKVFISGFTVSGKTRKDNKRSSVKALSLSLRRTEIIEKKPQQHR